MDEIKSKKKYNYTKEQIKQYNETFKQKHKDNIIYCSICYKEYPELNYYHNRSKEHLIALRILNEKSKADHEMDDF